MRRKPHPTPMPATPFRDASTHADPARSDTREGVAESAD